MKRPLISVIFIVSKYFGVAILMSARGSSPLAGAHLPSIVNGSAKSIPTGYIGNALTAAVDSTPGRAAMRWIASL